EANSYRYRDTNETKTKGNGHQTSNRNSTASNSAGPAIAPTGTPRVMATKPATETESRPFLTNLKSSRTQVIPPTDAAKLVMTQAKARTAIGHKQLDRRIVDQMKMNKIVGPIRPRSATDPIAGDGVIAANMYWKIAKAMIGVPVGAIAGPAELLAVLLTP
ncbi:16355_t:CDS:1, partial [Acaulospora morrowiae]